ncbi:MAG: type IX secretion system membrane protein PorP/SprF [Chlorobi bacterium]|nr:type IX secretion system membrane protein PorP/SprF [Chlorobiota bacterium]
MLKPRNFITCLFLFIGVMLPSLLWGQDVIFSQYLENSLSANPAFAGVSGNSETLLAYRQERFGALSQFETFSAVYQQPAEWLHGGFGVMLYRDAATRGFISKNAISVIYAYHLRLSRSWNLSSGFQTTFVQQNLNTNGIILPDMIDPSRGVVLPSSQTINPWSRFYFDFQVGFLMYDKHWFYSISAFHLMEPQMSPVKIPETMQQRRYSFFMGRSFIFDLPSSTFNKLKIVPWAGYFYQAGHALIRAGSSAHVGPLSAGLGWQGSYSRTRHYLISSFAFATKNIRFTYSYSVSPGRTSGGTMNNIHEITLSYFIDRENLLVLPFTINLIGF